MNSEIVKIFLLLGFTSVVLGASEPSVEDNSIYFSDVNATLALQEYMEANDISFGGFTSLIKGCSPPNRILNRTVTALADSNCKNLNIEYAIVEVGGKVYLNGEFCYYTGNNWKLKSHVQVTIFGHQIIDENDTLVPGQYEFSKVVDAGAAKANVAVGVYGKCIKIRGSGGYWAFNWRTADFSETVFCF